MADTATEKRQADVQANRAKQREPHPHGGEVFGAQVEEEALPNRKTQRLQGAKTFLFEDNFTWRGSSYRKGDVGSFDSTTVEAMMNSDELLPLREIDGLEAAPSAAHSIARKGEASSAGPPAMAATPLGPPEGEDSGDTRAAARDKAARADESRLAAQRQREADMAERTRTAAPATAPAAKK